MTTPTKSPSRVRDLIEEGRREQAALACFICFKTSEEIRAYLATLPLAPRETPRTP